MDFKDLKLNPQMLKAIAAKGYQKPTEIQQKAIPSILGGQDIIGIAQTGTGKTAAYLLPILVKLNFAQFEDPRAIILAPTRELAIQIDKEIEEFAAFTDLRHLAVYGGTGINPQMEAIEKGLDILVATPGRLLDISKKHGINLKRIRILVLDEADRVMDMGFMPQINRILELVPMKKQCMLFSATMSEAVERIASDFVEFPHRIEISPQATPAETVSQLFYRAPNIRSKINLLSYLLENKYPNGKVIVFCRTKKSADDVFKFIQRKLSEEVRVIHANKGQNTRINSINAFKNNEIRILVATDVSARGIDISDVVAVINFNVPIMYEDYVHRIGRTGRAENKGTAISMADEAEQWHLGEIEKLIQMKIPEKQWPAVVEITETPFEEQQAINRELDYLKRKNDPDFKGAFHEKNQHKRFGKKKKRRK
ncbi:DEAD/DEAH box helicase [Hyphobacterium sp. CCMP332]|nr:DEAD/DEAH box helicase [Hyphobacterium sp. CCMP332]